MMSCCKEIQEELTCNSEKQSKGMHILYYGTSCKYAFIILHNHFTCCRLAEREQEIEQQAAVVQQLNVRLGEIQGDAKTSDVRV